MQLKSKTAIIKGASNGLGAANAKAMIHEGATDYGRGRDSG